MSSDYIFEYIDNTGDIFQIFLNKKSLSTQVVILKNNSIGQYHDYGIYSLDWILNGYSELNRKHWKLADYIKEQFLKYQSFL